jgi:cell division protein FtsI (penicillin-binding protein 3)
MDMAYATGQNDPALQYKINTLLDSAKKRLKSSEILAVVIDTDTGQIRATGSTDRVGRKEGDFSRFLYEPGAVMKSIALAIALENGEITLDTILDVDTNRLRIERYFISDDRNITEPLTAEDALLRSSNVGIAQIVKGLSGEQLHSGLLAFGFGGVQKDIQPQGKIKTAQQLERHFYRTTTATGYGLLASPMQLVRAYSAFVNGGRITASSKETETKAPLSSSTALRMRQMLIQIVQRGTGKAAMRKGLTVGGKTGTAHRVVGGKYVDRYNSSFYGFVEDDAGHSYTIGVVVTDLDKRGRYFASQTAVPIWGDIVDTLVAQRMLTPKEPRLSIVESAASPLRHAKAIKPYDKTVDPKYLVNLQ